jgi:hypothetical protein
MIGGVRRELDSLHTLLNHGYFRRVWIIQEVILAKVIRVLCKGHIWVSWKKVQELTTDWVNLLHHVDHGNFFYKHPRRHFIALICEEPSAAQGLLEVINNFGQNDCGDPRDKVYGLMGIVHKEDRLVVDYGKTVCDVYIDVVKKSLEGGTHRLQRIKTLLTLSESMGFQKDQRTGLAKLLDAMFEQVCGLIRCIGYQTAEESGKTLDRWWYEDENGVRHFYECQNPPKEFHDRLQKRQIPRRDQK